MSLRGTFQRIVALTLILSLQAIVAPAAAGTPITASLTGRVLLANGQTPIGVGKVLVGDPRTGQIATAALSPEGTFTVNGLAPATYQVAVETGGVINVASNAVHLRPGESRAVRIAVDPNMAIEPTPKPEKENPKLGTIWNNPLTATAIVVVSAVVVGIAIDGLTDDDDEQPASAN